MRNFNPRRPAPAAMYDFKKKKQPKHEKQPRLTHFLRYGMRVKNDEQTFFPTNTGERLL